MPPAEQEEAVDAAFRPDAGKVTPGGGPDGSKESSSDDARADGGSSIADATSDYVFEANIPAEDGFGQKDSNDFHPPDGTAPPPDAPETID
jgi:hypothetical protein